MYKKIARSGKTCTYVSGLLGTHLADTTTSHNVANARMTKLRFMAIDVLGCSGTESQSSVVVSTFSLNVLVCLKVPRAVWRKSRGLILSVRRQQTILEKV